MFTTCDTVAAGLDPARWERVEELAAELCHRREVGAIGLFVARGRRTIGSRIFGRQRLDDPSDRSIRDDAIFLIASITKPIVVMSALLLVERGEVRLDDRVSRFLPEFGNNGKNGTRVRHLMTHTSGLPDMLPENRELREAGAGLDEFVRLTCGVKPDFKPGRGVQYQSMGVGVLGELITRVTGLTCGEWLRQQVLDKLGLHSTRLGAPDEWFDGEHPVVGRIAEIRTPEEQDGADWNWNRRYWRQLGAPWGGLLTTPRELGAIGRMMLEGGCGVVSPASIAAATKNQLAAMKDVPKTHRRCKPWGLGWRLNWPATSANFGDLLGPRTYGHWGATGTLMWIDPDSDTVCVILTTQPQEPHGREIAALSNAIAASLVE
tara:strand:- start:381 stop:1511 length:1131 start_codon:yes stop_codon:yes gene_type:complete